jgi:hypothetical protein
MKATCAELFCSHHGLPPARYAPALFWRILYPHAIPVAPVLRLLAPACFAPDFDLIREVGAMTRRDQLRDILADYRLDSRNRSWPRSRLRLRVSTRRLQQIVYALTGGDRPGDAIPTGDSASPTAGAASPDD